MTGYAQGGHLPGTGTKTVVPEVRRTSGLAKILGPLFCMQRGHRYLIDVVDGRPTGVRCQRCPVAWDLVPRTPGQQEGRDER